MNEFSGFARPARGGWLAMLRLARDGEAKPLLDKGGSPLIFADELSATKAVLQHAFAYFNGHLVRDGAVVGEGDLAGARAAANLVFSKGRVIKVERVGTRKGA